MKTKIVEWFKQNYEGVFLDMSNTEHAHSNGTLNPYHLEGDIWTHTMLVMDMVSFDINQIFAALLHDVGKVYTRHEKKNNRVVFMYHENVSMCKSIDILNHAKKEFHELDVLLILQLINWHGSLWNGSPVSEKLGQINDRFGCQPHVFESLVNFTESDAFGRNYSDDVQDNVDFITNQFEHLHNYIPFNKHQYREKRDLEAVFMIGISGSGKSTLISRRYNEEYGVVSVDKYFYAKSANYDNVDYKKNIKKAHNQSVADLKQFVLDRKNILVDMTNLSREVRGKKLVKIPSTQYTTKAVVFLIGEKLILENLKRRDHRKLTPEILNKQMTQFELPSYDEFDEIEYVFSMTA